MEKVIIFGTKDLAQLANFYLQRDSSVEVVGFTVNSNYLPDNKNFEGKNVFPFENLESQFLTSEYKILAPIYDNKVRKRIYQECKEKGYSLYSYISPEATVFQPENIGENCFILEDNTIQPFVSIGNNCILWSGNHLGHHSVVQDHVYFTSHVVMSGHCLIKSGAFLGVNATLRDGIVIEENSLVAMGAAVTKSTEKNGIYKGVPAKLCGYLE